MSEAIESCSSDAGSCLASPSSQPYAPPVSQKSKAPKPAPRRREKHTKSRSGCKTCKKRKVKCDESRPVCTRCERMGVSCLYLPEIGRTRRQHGQPGQHTQTPAAILYSQPGNSLHLDMPSLELLCSYTEYTSSTLPSASMLRGFWKTTVPRLALKHDYLMHALFALAALHKAQFRFEEREHYMSIAMRHHHHASKSARILLDNITPENGNALFLFSIFTCIVVLNLPEPPSEADSSENPCFFRQWYWTMHGIRSITDFLGSAIQRGYLAPLTTYFGARWSLQDSGLLLATTLPTVSIVDMLDELQQRLNDTVLDPEELGSYTSFLDRLREAAGTMSSWQEFDVFVWLFRSLDEFALLLQLPTQETMVLWAHVAVVVKAFEGQWWLKGWADNIMSLVYQRLDWEHTTWVYRAAVEMNWIMPEEEVIDPQFL
ncbi:Sterol uptake control protein 2 like [Verticillium longisporum]|uniref:Sterol uptake control protein 2 like n=1 Tax=Verticillium longisporum TaxID=100787 RepID=A0A8I2Z7E0_VERLO|nr:Sterol uptake control protein 2 like [Verticillium longisporum]